MTHTWIGVEDHRSPQGRTSGVPTDEWRDCNAGVMVDATQELWGIHVGMPVILGQTTKTLGYTRPQRTSWALSRNTPPTAS